MRRIVTSCPFVPLEWIAAHGLEPRRILPRGSTVPFGGVSQGVCPRVLAVVGTIQESEDIAGVILTTTCDQMRRGAELVEGKPLFLMNVPATWQSRGSRELYVAELERLGRFLCSVGGRVPLKDRLIETLLEYDEARRESRDTGEARRPGVEVALVGGGMLEHQLELFDVVTAAGGTVVLDATTTGERALPAPLDRERLRRDPLGALADAHFGAIPDAFRRPDTALHTWLKARFASRGVRGVLFLHHTWCDLWAAEVERIREWCDLPLLVLDSAGGHILDERTITRVQAFVETLQ